LVRRHLELGLRHAPARPLVEHVEEARIGEIAIVAPIAVPAAKTCASSVDAGVPGSAARTAARRKYSIYRR
jgi:hypothetical protein